MASLPLDLERLIFELAAVQDTDHDSRVRLILVAKRVCEWIRPILYCVAVSEVTYEGRVTIRNWRNAQIADVAPFTRHLLVNSRSHVDFLSTFPNVENLAVWLTHIGPQNLQKINKLPLRMLSVILAHTTLYEAIEYCPSARNVTHLEIISRTPGRLTSNDSKVLAEFPKLTHLGIDSRTEVKEIVLDLLEHCPSLRAMIYQPGHECTFKTDDPRFLVLDYPYIANYVGEWEKSASGGIGLWELADIIIEARKDKLFEDNMITFSRSNWMDSLNENGIRWYKEWLRNGRPRMMR